MLQNDAKIRKTEGPLFDQKAKDVKSMFTFEMWPRAEIKNIKKKTQKILPFWISALSLEVTLKM